MRAGGTVVVVVVVDVVVGDFGGGFGFGRIAIFDANFVAAHDAAGHGHDALFSQDALLGIAFDATVAKGSASPGADAAVIEDFAAVKDVDGLGTQDATAAVQ